MNAFPFALLGVMGFITMYKGNSEGYYGALYGLIDMGLLFAVGGLAGTLASNYVETVVYNAKKNGSNGEGSDFNVCCIGNLDNNVTGGKQ